MQLRTNSLFIQNFLQRRSGSLSLVWQRLKSRHGSRKVCSEKRGRLQICPDWRLLSQGSGGGITRSEGSYVSDLRSIFAFSSWSWIGKRSGVGVKVKKLSVIDQVSQLLRRLWLGFWDSLLLCHSLLYIVKHCPFVYSAYQFPLLVNFSPVRSWQMQNSLENQIVSIYWMYSFLHSQLYYEIFLTFLLCHYHDPLTRE